MAHLLGQSRRFGGTAESGVEDAEGRYGGGDRVACTSSFGNAHDRRLWLRGRRDADRAGAYREKPGGAAIRANRCASKGADMPRDVHPRQGATLVDASDQIANCRAE